MKNNLKTLAIVRVLAIFLAGVLGMVWMVQTSLKAQSQISYLQDTINLQSSEYAKLNSEYNAALVSAQTWYDKYQDARRNPIVVERVVEKIIYQDRIVEKPVPQTLSDWQSLEELTQFLKDDQTDKTVFFSLVTGQAIRDCDDYAMLLRDQAIKTGKFISLQVISPAEYVALENRPWYSNPQDKHMMNSAIVDGRLYLIEPQTDEVWAKERLD